MTEPVALAIREHQAGVDGWAYRGLADELHRWVGILDCEFKLELPSYPILKFAPLRNAYATYENSRGELGTKDNITFNCYELDDGLGSVLATLCHELVHLWQEYHGRPGKWNYHNIEFRKKALECGLVVDARGCETGHTDTFIALLRRHGVSFDAKDEDDGATRLPITLHGARKRAYKLKKWSCGCTNVRCATMLRARCERCGVPFMLT